MWKFSNEILGFVEIFLKEAQEEAKKSLCERRRCGSIIVKESKIIGRGFNSPPGKLESQRRCLIDKISLGEITDKTCCVHAEQRAIVDALKKGNDLGGSVLYFTSVNQDGKRIYSGKPYCTGCSKMALDSSVWRWVLEHEEGIFLYNSEEYNNISFQYHH
jgi:deoxycytidylate deaminase